MIVVDASAIVAILNKELNHQPLVARLQAFDERFISPVSTLEVAMALARKYVEPASIIDAYFQRLKIAIHPIDSEQAQWARSAFLIYGKGRHPARLNLGDCFSYAAAKALDAPLLYIGNDFGLTDVKTA